MVLKWLLLSVSVLATAVLAYEVCTKEEGGGICPDGNTCCRLFPDRLMVDEERASGCIANDLGSYNATCCPDGKTGCAVGYRCDVVNNHSVCLAGAHTTDPLVQTLPRYVLCHSMQLARVYGFSVFKQSHSAPKLPYYSSHGPILDEESWKMNRFFPATSIIQRVLLVVHGAGRNADDYFCSMNAVVRSLPKEERNTVLVLAPQFMVPSDDCRLAYNKNPHSSSSSACLVWSEADPNGSWRYGADSISSNTHVSSFEVLDALVQAVQARFPRAVLTVVGHSSGGQMIQRWSLLTPISWTNPCKLRAIVANPSSYIYLSKSRPFSTTVEECPLYNQWEWGLETTAVEKAPAYVKQALGNISQWELETRFSSRRLQYWIGSLDRCNVSDSTSNGSWCNSHGLETTCMDECQGRTRWERHEEYLSSLRRMGIDHKQVVVERVGHDHSLMFTSPIGSKLLLSSCDGHTQQQSNIETSKGLQENSMER